MNERIGILGGTLDPIHCGHLEAMWKQVNARRTDLEHSSDLEPRTSEHA